MAAATTVGTGHPSMPVTLLVMEITQQKSNGEWKTIIHFSKRPSISINNSFHFPIGNHLINKNSSHLQKTIILSESKKCKGNLEVALVS